MLFVKVQEKFATVFRGESPPSQIFVHGLIMKSCLQGTIGIFQYLRILGDISGLSHVALTPLLELQYLVTLLPSHYFQIKRSTDGLFPSHKRRLGVKRSGVGRNCLGPSEILGPLPPSRLLLFPIRGFKILGPRRRCS